MKYYLNAIAMLAIFTVFSVTAHAGESVTREVKAGKKTLIYRLAVHLTTCGHVSYPQFSSRGAKNGKLSAVNGSFIAQSGQCKGKRLRSTDVYYTPNPGFRGTEKVRALFGYPRDPDSDWGTVYDSVRITVNVK